MLGTTLGPYRIDAEISRGGMGTVYRATDTATGRLVALKVLDSALARDRHFMQRFLREARAIQQVHHPHVVRIYDIGAHDGAHYFAMEHLERSLADLLADGPLEPTRALEIAGQAARGLQAVHAAGILHRDVKPSNILFGPDGAARISDFGIARLTDATRMTHTGAILGTPTYMAPEQAEGPNVDARADIYSLGVVLYEMTCGRPPFAGKTAMAVLRHHRFSLPESPKAYRPELATALCALILQMLEKSPARRPDSMGLLANAMERIRRNLAGEQHPRGTTTGFHDRAATRRAERLERAAARYFAWARRAALLALAALVAYAGYRLVAYLRTGPDDYLRRGQAVEAIDHRAAIDTYQTLLRRFPQAPQAAEARGRIKTLAERTQSGRGLFLGAAARHAMRAEMAYLHFRRARAAAEEGRPDDARRIYRLVCDHFADTQWAPRADARLQELDSRQAPQKP